MLKWIWGKCELQGFVKRKSYSPMVIVCVFLLLVDHMQIIHIGFPDSYRSCYSHTWYRFTTAVHRSSNTILLNPIPKHRRDPPGVCSDKPMRTKKQSLRCFGLKLGMCNNVNLHAKYLDFYWPFIAAYWVTWLLYNFQINFGRCGSIKDGC